MEKIQCILLVDDDATTNFLNEELILEMGIAEEVHVALNGQEALDYINLKGKFKTKKNQTYPRPNIIFLDINMPVMDGFEFLIAYNKLPKSKKAEVLVVFLTTSDSHKDKLKVIDNKLVYDYIEKPLRKEKLHKLYRQYLKDKN